ncbi:hypothetical protein ABW20_dc0100206 [Dactylellina cionopaga]|nr:hypothetical protein ABW20_dc0100206 [Dactylellina cionopaga]
MDPIIHSAVEKSSSITGKGNTPAVLDEILRQTEGRSLKANRELVLDNAKIGAQIAVEYSRLHNEFIANNPRPIAEERKKTRGGKKSRSKTGHSSGTRLQVTTEMGNTPAMPSRRSYSTTTMPRLDTTDGISSSELAASADVKIETTEIEITKLEETQTEETEIKEIKPAVKPGGILVVGGVGVDYISTSSDSTIKEEVSNPGNIKFSVGGVAKNIAATIKQLDHTQEVRFLSAIGKDWNGLSVLQELDSLGISLDDIELKLKFKTACYMAMNSQTVKSGLAAAIADMHIITSINSQRVTEAVEKYKPEIVCFDANLSPTTIEDLCRAAKSHGAIVACEPTSAPKCEKIATILARLGQFPNHVIDIISPNELELKALYEIYVSAAQEVALKSGIETEDKLMRNKLLKGREYETLINSEYVNVLKRFQGELALITGKARAEKFTEIVRMAVVLLPVIPTMLIKFGGDGVLVVRLLTHPDPDFTAKPRGLGKNAIAQSPYPINQQIAGSARKYNYLSRTRQYKGYTNASLFLPMKSYDENDRLIGINIDWTPAEAIPGNKQPVNSNGAGDTFFGAFLQGLLSRNRNRIGAITATPWLYYEEEYLKVLLYKAQNAAVHCLLSNESHYVEDNKQRLIAKKLEEAKVWKKVTTKYGQLQESTEENPLDTNSRVLPKPKRRTISKQRKAGRREKKRVSEEQLESGLSLGSPPKAKDTGEEGSQ